MRKLIAITALTPSVPTTVAIEGTTSSESLPWEQESRLTSIPVRPDAIVACWQVAPSGSSSSKTAGQAYLAENADRFPPALREAILGSAGAFDFPSDCNDDDDMTNEEFEERWKHSEPVDVWFGPGEPEPRSNQ